MTTLRIALVGATGAVGSAFLDVLEHLELRYGQLDLLASGRSAGRELQVGGRSLEVSDLELYDFSSCDVAFFSAGSSVSEVFAPRAIAAGCTVIDNTSRFRLEPDVPLIVPAINGRLLDGLPRGTLIANPNCSTIQIVKVLAPIRRLFGHRRSVVSTYQAASGAGAPAVQEMLEHSRAETPPERSEFFFGRSLAYNVVPIIDQLYDDGWTREEHKIRHESRKILEDESLRITATTVRVPVDTGHSVAMYTMTERPIDRRQLVEELANDDELIVCEDEPPTPRFIERKERTYVGRIRVDPDDPCGLWTWIVADNLWVGAAFNGAQIAAALIERGRLVRA